MRDHHGNATTLSHTVCMLTVMTWPIYQVLNILPRAGGRRVPGGLPHCRTFCRDVPPAADQAFAEQLGAAQAVIRRQCPHVTAWCSTFRTQ
jgi:hypothetical protein